MEKGIESVVYFWCMAWGIVAFMAIVIGSIAAYDAHKESKEREEDRARRVEIARVAEKTMIPYMEKILSELEKAAMVLANHRDGLNQNHEDLALLGFRVDRVEEFLTEAENERINSLLGKKKKGKC